MKNPEEKDICPNCGTPLEVGVEGELVCPEGDYPVIDWALEDETEETLREED